MDESTTLEKMLKQKPCSQETSCFYDCDNIPSIQKNPWQNFVCRDIRAGQSFELRDVDRRQQWFDDEDCSCDAL